MLLCHQPQTWMQHRGCSREGWHRPGMTDVVLLLLGVVKLGQVVCLGSGTCPSAPSGLRGLVYWWGCGGPCWGPLACCPGVVPRAHTVPAEVPGLKTSVIVACWLEVLGFFQLGEDPSLQPCVCLTQAFAACWCRCPHSYPQIS